MLLLVVIFTIIHIRTSQCVRATPGHPVPHADILDDLLTKFLGDSYSNSALFDFILGGPIPNKDVVSAGDNLDISILDVDSVRRIINFAKKKHENVMLAAPANETRRYKRHPRDETYKWHTYVCNKTIDLMKQTMYMTQEKVNYTTPYRKKYKDNRVYQVALLYGAAAAMLTKMEGLLAQMKHFIPETHFIWYLIVYEKVLVVNIDITDAIEKLFMIEEENDKAMGGKKEQTSRLNLTSAQLKELLEDPVALEKYKKEHGIDIGRSGRRPRRN